MNKPRALFIDVDDTLVHFKKTGGLSGADVQNTGSLFDVLKKAGVELAGLSSEEASMRIERVKKEVSWWHWSDYMIELGLDAKRFWDFAYEVESEYLEATDPDILPVLTELRSRGFLLYITSNNPSSGILHKLRLAGVAHIHGSILFHQLLGATELHALKWEPRYWKKVLAHTGLSGAEAMVIGDNIKDDFEIPVSVGIAGTFLFRSQAEVVSDPRLIRVNGFREIGLTLS